MADPVVSVVVETISNLLLDEVNFLSGVRDQVDGLQAELEGLKSYMEDANKRKHEEKSVRTSVRQARLLAYRAEDVIEEYAIKVASKRGGGFTKVARRVACIVGEGISTHNVGNEIDKIKTDIASLKNRLESYGIIRNIEAPPSPATIEQQRRRRTTYAHEVDEYFVGMEDDVSKIVAWVTEGEESHRVISICGIGGLGKTTIARKVYNHRQVQSSFECFVWVSVTQQCQVKMLLQDILLQIKGEKGGDLEEEALVRKLYDELKTKKCFVVLDDVWEIKDWKSLHKAFPTLEGSSKILLTTRISEVAEVAHLQHEPALLDEKDGLDLLMKIAFSLLQEEQANELSKTVESVGRDILGKCGGLPLAIAVLGGILKGKHILSGWETVNNEFETHVREKGGIVEVLAFSYHDLPSDLRPCFLYMGCFEEDEDIDVTRLYQLWMAEGLIPCMDVGSDFLEELISRNMVQPQVVRDVGTNWMTCRIHDLVRELCLTKGIDEEFPKIQICDERVGTEVKFPGKEKSTTNNTNIRALIILNDHTQEVSFQEICFQRSIVFRNLRSLILDNCKFKGNKLPKQIRDMIHLRCLSLEYAHFGKLPSFIGELQYLQTLNLHGTPFPQVPNIFHKMKRLRCLYLPRYRVGRGLEYHGLKDLEVLEGLNTEYDKFSLSEFRNIRRLSVYMQDYETLSTMLEELSSMLKVQSISIYLFLQLESESEVKKLLLCPHLRDLELNKPIGKFPRYEPHFWPDLVSLQLSHTELEEDPMPFLHELPNLTQLNIGGNAYVGKEMYCSSKAFPKLRYLIIWGLNNIEIWRVDAGAFPKLTSLEISNLHNIETWRVDAGAFPNLSTLDIKYCKSFEIVPDGLTSITSLNKIDIDDAMPEEFRIKYGSLQNINH